MCPLQVLLLTLNLDLFPNILAKRHEALGLGALLRMITAECDQLLADSATAIYTLLADLGGVVDETLHPDTRRRMAIGIATMAGVDQCLDKLLQVQSSCYFGIGTLALGVFRG
jgi:hypothetical protein